MVLIINNVIGKFIVRLPVWDVCRACLDSLNGQQASSLANVDRRCIIAVLFALIFVKIK